VDELVRRRSAAFVGGKSFDVGARRDVRYRDVLILLLRLPVAGGRQTDAGEHQQPDCSAHSILPRHLSRVQRSYLLPYPGRSAARLIAEGAKTLDALVRAFRELRLGEEPAVALEPAERIAADA